MLDGTPTVLLSSEQVQARISELASEIRRGYGADCDLHLLSVLKGGFMFLADLARALSGPVTVDFVAVESYGARTESAGRVRLRQDLVMPVAGRDVLIVEDIVDTGRTLSWLRARVRAGRPRSLRTVALLDKPSRRRVAVDIEYVGFTIEDRFVIGYGLDYGERFRNLPHIAVLNPCPAGGEPAPDGGVACNTGSGR